jgi:hypothetical protein
MKFLFVFLFFVSRLCAAQVNILELAANNSEFVSVGQIHNDEMQLLYHTYYKGKGPDHIYTNDARFEYIHELRLHILHISSLKIGDLIDIGNKEILEYKAQTFDFKNGAYLIDIRKGIGNIKVVELSQRNIRIDLDFYLQDRDGKSTGYHYTGNMVFYFNDIGCSLQPDPVALDSICQGRFRLFKWSDTLIAGGMSQFMHFDVELEGPCSAFLCYGTRNNRYAYDSLFVFLFTHPNLKIELRSHADKSIRFPYYFEMYQQKSERYAGRMKEILFFMGIDSSRISIKGAGSSEPLVPPLKEGHSEMEIFHANWWNSMMEIRIL